MSTLNQKIAELAGEMSRNFETKERRSGVKFVCQKVMIKWQQDICLKAHGDKGPDDTTYKFIEKAVDALSNLTEDQDPEDLINEIEEDIYTSDLTEWLNLRNDHVYYLTGVLRDFGGIDDGFQLLGAAQKMQIDEVAHLVLEGLKERAEELVQA